MILSVITFDHNTLCSAHVKSSRMKGMSFQEVQMCDIPYCLDSLQKYSPEVWLEQIV